MSETRDLFIYNFYDYMSSIFIYSHVKTYLIDPNRQKVEKIIDIILLVISAICFSATLFKINVIILYFAFFHALPAFCKFLKVLCKTKFRINFSLTICNALNFFKKICKRIITFNFKLYHNNYVGFIMIFSYLFFLIISFEFYRQNNIHVDEVEKSFEYMIYFYLHFESILLVQLLCSSFYACKDTRDMNSAILSALGIFILLNLILFISYFIKDRIENVEGIFEHYEPQLITNLVFNFIFILINGKCLYNIIRFNKNCKL